MAAKKDTGIIPELGITEERRDELAKRDWTKPAAKPEENPDNYTTKDCIEKQFSGIRVNKMNGMTEMWVVGQMRSERKTDKVAANPALLADMHEEAFNTVGSIASAAIPRKHVMKMPNTGGRFPGGRKR